MQESLYGEGGFYRHGLPGEHFRTSVTAADAVRVSDSRARRPGRRRPGYPDPFDVVDVGAGGGELLAGLGAVPARWRLTGVDLSGRFTASVPRVIGLLIANEWLDNVPLDVVEDGRLVEVDERGRRADRRARERGRPGLGCALVARSGRRVEVGRPRDEAWRPPWRGSTGGWPSPSTTGTCWRIAVRR